MTKFVNPSKILAQVDIPKGGSIADFGCGSGFYTLAASQAVGKDGTVYAIDILPDKLAFTQSSAQHETLRNVTVLQADLEQPLQILTSVLCDLVIMSNIVHLVAKKDMLFQNAYRVLKTGGHLLVIDWKKELSPIGPPPTDRLTPEQIAKIAESHSFRWVRELEADGYHYAVLFTK